MQTSFRSCGSSLNLNLNLNLHLPLAVLNLNLNLHYLFPVFHGILSRSGRGAAWFSALALGARGRWFKSSRPDHVKTADRCLPSSSELI
jgi:hypothetical protein